jgi:hypothetical protein
MQETHNKINKFITNMTAKLQASVSGTASVDNRGHHLAHSNAKKSRQPRLHNILTQYQPTTVATLDVSPTKYIYLLITLLPKCTETTRSYVWTADSFMTLTSKD